MSNEKKTDRPTPPPPKPKPKPKPKPTTIPGKRIEPPEPWPKRGKR